MSMARKNLLAFIRRNPFNRFLVGFITTFAVLLIAGLIFVYPVKALYFGAFDGNFFLNVKSAVAEPKVETDDSLSVAFCREPRTRIIAVNNVRTFYLAKDGVPVYERKLPDGISYERNDDVCVPISIKPDQRPNELGKYRFCQEFDFETEFGQKKSANFCSTEYEIVGRAYGP